MQQLQYFDQDMTEIINPGDKFASHPNKHKALDLGYLESFSCSKIFSRRLSTTGKRVGNIALSLSPSQHTADLPALLLVFTRRLTWAVTWLGGLVHALP